MCHMHGLRAYALLQRFNAPKRGVAKTQFHQYLAEEKETGTGHLVNNLVNKMVEKSASVIPPCFRFYPSPTVPNRTLKVHRVSVISPMKTCLLTAFLHLHSGTRFKQHSALIFRAGTSIALRNITRCHVETNVYANLHAWTSSVL